MAKAKTKPAQRAAAPRGMTVETVTIASLELDPRNARRHPDRNLASIKRSLEPFGQQKPIVVDADGVIIAGNGTVTAARALGWESSDVVRTKLRGAEARAFAIADNRTGELAEWDAAELRAQLDELEAEGFDLDADLAFSEADVAALVKDVEQGTDGDAGGGSGGGKTTAGAAASVGSVEDQYKIVLKCRDEMHQTDLLDALDHNDGGGGGAAGERLAGLLKSVESRALVG
jgi:hypothetical protein